MRHRSVFIAFVLGLLAAGLHCDPTDGLQGGDSANDGKCRFDDDPSRFDAPPCEFAP